MNANQTTAAETILTANYREFHRFLARRLGDDTLAEDVLHDALARGLEKLDGLRDERALLGWFYRSLRNAIIDHHRRLDVARRALSSLEADLERETNTLEAESTPCRCVLGALETLRPDYAEALTGLEVEDLTVQEYAAAAAITPNNAAVRGHRARQALRKAVERLCGPSSATCCGNCQCGATPTGRCAS
ncbi:MAG: sigma-70 family RNA polymerase sigma factor [Myxococcales bacterium]|nr:sigma-70 family RNA polymerase sigma factor [Myxococcales bacterium]